MSLFDVKNKLYKKEDPTDLARPTISEYDPHSELADASRLKSEEGDLWEAQQSIIGQPEKKAARHGLWALGIVIGLIVLLVAGYETKQALFMESAVSVSVSGPTQTASGKMVTFEIDYENNNLTSLNNAILEVTYPEAITPINNSGFKTDSPTSGSFSLGTIAARGTGKAIFNVRAYSPRGALVYLKAQLQYGSSLSPSRYEAQNQLGVTVAQAAIDFEVQAPQTISSGNEIKYQITYLNNGSQPQENLKVKMDYPAGFTFSSSTPLVSESNDIWYVGELMPGASGKIVIDGKLDGNREETKLAKAYIGTDQGGTLASMSEQDVTTQISSSPLEIAQTVNGLASLTADSGENLLFDVNFKNTGNIGLSNVIVTEKLSSPVLDYTSLKLSGGNYDQSNQMITWKAADIPDLANLAPGQGGDIKFTVSVKDIIPVSSANDQNYVISSLAKIDSPDVPTPLAGNKIISSNLMDIKLNSKLILDTKGYHNEPSAAIVNSGPIPPHVGQATTYTLHWRLINVSNAVSNVQVMSSLPTGVTYTGKIYPEDARLSYNPRTNSLAWNVGNVPAGTGILTAPEEVIFQVAITPAPNQVGYQLGLLSASALTAHDDFTGQDLKVTGDAKDTGLPEDPSLLSGGRVAN
ncbi:MAG: hypothetical protein P4L62_00650 [Candidatus Pacebacteria bacterium]|nr:hypothetical protein [Candidatus Paceibacterota bacterium]MDR3582858.1 hypothetical protein [Candidatus Paceibacterota bacterium]